MKVLRTFVVLTACLLFSGVAMAQETPTVELFGGYTFIHFNAGSGSFVVPTPVGTGLAARALQLDPAAPVSTTLTSNVNGGSASFAYNFNKWFGMAADFGGGGIATAHLSGLPDVDVSSTLFTYLFGPRISYRGNKTFTPFFQVLVGGAHFTDISSHGVRVAKAENGFAMTAGGGLDWNLNNRWAIRLGQVEYLLTRFTDPFSITGASGNQNNIRFSTGVVVRFGSKK